MNKELIGWYKRPSPVGHYYTPFKQSKTKYSYLGNGNKAPTPYEIVEFLKSTGEKHVEYDDGYFMEYDHEDTGEETVDIPFGSYFFESESPGTPPRLVPFDLRSDEYIKIPGLYDAIQEDVQSFIDGEQVYRDMKIQYRRGIFLYGSPGNGKTSLIRELIRTYQKKNNAIAIFIDKLPGKNFIEAIRKTMSNRLKIIVFEELAAVLEHTRLETVLDFLDGERSLDNALIFGTTNYPERLPGNIVDRPSRFDKLYRMSDPPKESREHFLKHFMGEDYVLDKKHVEITKGLSVAAIREVALMARNRKFKIEESVLSLKDHKERVKKAFAEQKNAIGISSHPYDSEDDGHYKL